MLHKPRIHGFTLIELLVVIAVIGILAAIVLAALNSSRAKGADAAIKSNVNNTRASAELYYYNNNNSYDPGVAGSGGGWVCAEAAIVNASTTVRDNGGSFACSASVTAWRISSTLISTPTLSYCVDSTGKATSTASAISGSACP